MPANPLHFSAIAPLHFKQPERFDITALLYSSTLVDLEMLFIFFTEKHYNHGFWHSYFFVLTIYPIALSLILYAIERKFEKSIISVYNFFKFFPRKVKYSFKTVYFCCLIGGVSHIFFDMWTHETSSYVLYPLLKENPFWMGEWNNNIIQAFVIVLSLYTVFLWIKQTSNKPKKR